MPGFECLVNENIGCDKYIRMTLSCLRIPLLCLTFIYKNVIFK